MIDNSLFLRAINNETSALLELGNIYLSGSEGEENKERASVFFGKAVENALKKAKDSDISELELVIRFLEEYSEFAEKTVVGKPEDEEVVSENDTGDIFSGDENVVVDKGLMFRSKGKEYFENEEYEDAIECFEKAIENGDDESSKLLTEAKFKLAYKAYYGADGNPDFVESEKLFREVAESNDERFCTEAKLCLAELYATRLDRKEDAVTIWQELAAEGVADAQYNYGLALFNGLGVEQSEERGVYWWQKAAKNGHADAKYNVEVFFSNT